MNTKLPAEELAEELETLEPDETPRPRRNSASPPSALRETASLVSLIQANMREQTDRIARFAEAHEQHNTIFQEIIEQLKALGEILEEHTASLEESLERIETVTAAYIKMIEHQTSQRQRDYQQTTTQASATSATN